MFLRLWASAIGDEEPVLHEAFKQRDAFFRSHFEAALAEGIADQTVRADIDTTATAVMLVGLLRGVAMQWQLAPELVHIDEVHATATRLIDGALTPVQSGGTGRRTRAGAGSVRRAG